MIGLELRWDVACLKEGEEGDGVGRSSSPRRLMRNGDDRASANDADVDN